VLDWRRWLWRYFSRFLLACVCAGFDILPNYGLVVTTFVNEHRTSVWIEGRVYEVMKPICSLPSSIIVTADFLPFVLFFKKYHIFPYDLFYHQRKLNYYL
jgi:hypothetical protein